jgi:ElaB/YqjD/DUF883 family membrane-anchored ribosome-binding protein
MRTTEQLDKVVDDLKTLGHDADTLAKATVGDARDQACELRERIGKALESARRNCERTSEKVRSRIKATDGLVRGKPYQSIGLAFGAGLVLGALTMWRRKD